LRAERAQSKGNLFEVIGSLPRLGDNSRAQRAQARRQTTNNRRRADDSRGTSDSLVAIGDWPEEPAQALRAMGDGRRATGD